MNPEIVREFRRLRGKGWTFDAALRGARIDVAWQVQEDLGNVKIDWEPDCEQYDDSYLETWGLTPRALEYEREKLWRLVEREGVWGIVGKYLDPETGDWETAESFWGVVGYNPDSGEDVDIKQATLAALDELYNRMARDLEERPTLAGVFI